MSRGEIHNPLHVHPCPPPSYSKVESEETLKQVLYDLQENFGFCDTGLSENIERIRRLLLHRLAIDYRLNFPPPLSAADKLHFWRVYRTMSDLDPNFEEFNEPATESLAVFLESQIRQPALALGIPMHVIADAICQTTQFRGWNGTYISRLRFDKQYLRLSETSPLQSIGAKFLIDKELVIKAIVPASNQALRQALFDNLAKEQSRWFSSFDNMDSYMMTEEGLQLENESKALYIFERTFEPVRSSFINVKRCWRAFCHGFEEVRKEARGPPLAASGSPASKITAANIDNGLWHTANRRRHPDHSDIVSRVGFDRKVGEKLTVTILSSHGRTLVDQVEAENVSFEKYRERKFYQQRKEKKVVR